MYYLLSTDSFSALCTQSSVLSACGSFWSQGLKIQRFRRQSESGLLHPSSWPAAVWTAYSLSNAQLVISSLWKPRCTKGSWPFHVGTLLRYVSKNQEMVQIFNLYIVLSSFISNESRIPGITESVIHNLHITFYPHVLVLLCILFLNRSSYPTRELQWCAHQMSVSEIAQIPSQHGIMKLENIQIQCLQMTSKWAGTETRKCLKLAERMCQEQGYLNPIILQNLGCYFFNSSGTLLHTRAFDQCLTWTKIKCIPQLGQCQMYPPAG